MRSPQLAVIAATVLTFALLAGAAAPRLRAQAPGAPVPVAIANFAYAPEELTVPVGASVIWTNTDEASHDVVGEDRSFSSLLLTTGQRYQTRFDAPGRFSYFCSLHPGMAGVVNVEVPGREARAFLPQVLLPGEAPPAP